jgi:Fur family ferric uptake transcriptional regulator
LACQDIANALLFAIKSEVDMKRLTKQRKAILECLMQSQRPLSIEEILLEVSLIIPSINLSTVYRNLKVMLDETVLQSYDLPGSAPRYQVVHSEHTHHFLCEDCNRLFNIHLCPKEIHAMVPQGFQMHSHSITLKGQCRECLS